MLFVVFIVFITINLNVVECQDNRDESSQPNYILRVFLVLLLILIITFMMGLVAYCLHVFWDSEDQEGGEFDGILIYASSIFQYICNLLHFEMLH